MNKEDQIIKLALSETSKLTAKDRQYLLDHMNDKEFRIKYLTAKTDLLRTADNSLDTYIESAIATVAGIMSDPATDPDLKLKAANLLFTGSKIYNDKLHAAENELKEIADPFNLDI